MGAAGWLRARRVRRQALSGSTRRGRGNWRAHPAAASRAIRTRCNQGGISVGHPGAWLRAGKSFAFTVSLLPVRSRVPRGCFHSASHEEMTRIQLAALSAGPAIPTERVRPHRPEGALLARAADAREVGAVLRAHTPPATPSTPRTPSCALRTSLNCTRAAVGITHDDGPSAIEPAGLAIIADDTTSLPRAAAASQPSPSAAATAVSSPSTQARSVGAVSRQKCVQSVTRTPCDVRVLARTQMRA